MSRLVQIAGVVWLSACTAADNPDAVDATDSVAGTVPPAALVVMDAWQEDAELDPMEEHRPAEAECGLGGWGPEGATVEVDTGACDFLSVRQPLLVDLSEGEPLELVFWHTWLTAEEPAQGHFALFVGDALLFERWIEIPADPGSYTETFDSLVSADEGTPVTLHVHNHGANTWNMLRLERVEAR